MKLKRTGHQILDTECGKYRVMGGLDGWYAVERQPPANTNLFERPWYVARADTLAKLRRNLDRFLADKEAGCVRHRTAYGF